MELELELETKIGYDRIRQQVEALCTTAGAREGFRAERFSTKKEIISQRLRLSDQMRIALMMESGFPTGEYIDIEQILKKIEVEGLFWEIEEIGQIRAALGIIRDLIRFFGDKSEQAYPDLIALSRGVSDFAEIANHIDSIIDRHGVVRDSASKELYSIRRSLREMEGQVTKRLRQILAQAQQDGSVESDATISIRDGRAVIPVLAANKRRVKGFIHDESATGKTVYIEPVEVVEINNELRELEHQERREIVRILTEFTESVRPDVPELRRSGQYLIKMDMIRAKARFATSISGVMPIISHDGTLELRKARHPILEQTLKKEGREIVPLDLMITREEHILIISGPNAGGKSVCLKTVGLLQWMFQCGMLVPLLENSQLPIFDAIFIDIGDQQSIDNDLSTYSSHLMNMKRMLQSAGRESLILIDEFGSGTEPIIGGAIAEAILERLEAKGCYGIITTHYSNLKYYASSADGGVVNGAMTFDVQNIQPLFKLEIGSPGSSFAIEIARKIGLPEQIIESASQRAGTDHINIEKQLREISRDKRYWSRKRDRIRKTDIKVEEMERKYAEELNRTESERAQIIKRAKEEAEKITVEANRRIELAIKTIRESQADKEKTRFARKEIDSFKESLESVERKSEQERVKIEREMKSLMDRQKRRRDGADDDKRQPIAKPEKEIVRLDPIEGSKVKMEGQSVVGEVISLKGGKATVAFGQITTTVAVKQLTVVSNTEYKRQQRAKGGVTVQVSADISERKLRFTRNIDLRGVRLAESLERVEEFIDDAIMLGVGEVRILHGKGTGVLKEEIRNYLKTITLVESAEDEDVQLGGSGITVVKMKL